MIPFHTVFLNSFVCKVLRHLFVTQMLKNLRDMRVKEGILNASLIPLVPQILFHVLVLSYSLPILSLTIVLSTPLSYIIFLPFSNQFPLLFPFINPFNFYRSSHLLSHHRASMGPDVFLTLWGGREYGKGTLDV